MMLNTCHGPVEYAFRGEAGPVVLALHGAMGGWDQADILARTLDTPGMRFLCLSRPGYLGTPLSAGRTAEEQADFYASVLDALNIPKVTVVAISGGGPSALHFAVRHRDRCRSLVLISTCGSKSGGPIPLRFTIMMALVKYLPIGGFLKKKAVANRRANLQRSISDPVMLEKLLADPISMPLMDALTLSTFDKMAMRLSGTQNDIRMRACSEYPLASVSVPTLVVHGDRDPLVPFEDHGKLLAENIPGAELLLLKGGEHVALFTHRELIRDRVNAFIRQTL